MDRTGSGRESKRRSVASSFRTRTACVADVCTHFSKVALVAYDDDDDEEAVQGGVVATIGLWFGIAHVCLRRSKLSLNFGLQSESRVSVKCVGCVRDSRECVTAAKCWFWLIREWRKLGHFPHITHIIGQAQRQSISRSASIGTASVSSQSQLQSQNGFYSQL